MSDSVSLTEAYQIAVHAGQGNTVELAKLVKQLAAREGTSPAQILLGCNNGLHETPAHLASQAGQIRSIETLAKLLGTDENRAAYFNVPDKLEFLGDLPVHSAMRHGFFDVFKVLVANGADPTMKNRYGDAVEDFLGDHEPEDVRRVIEEYRRKMGRGA